MRWRYCFLFILIFLYFLRHEINILEENYVEGVPYAFWPTRLQTGESALQNVHAIQDVQYFSTMRTSEEYTTVLCGMAPTDASDLCCCPPLNAQANPRRQQAQDKTSLLLRLYKTHPTVPSGVRPQGSASGAMMAVCALLYPPAAYEASPSLVPLPLVTPSAYLYSVLLSYSSYISRIGTMRCIL